MGLYNAKGSESNDYRIEDFMPKVKPCEHCQFEFTTGEEIAKAPFEEGFGITAKIKRDDDYFMIVEDGTDDMIIGGIHYCPMCGRKLEEK